ncbi:MAG: hypothetical protein JST22_13590 [Bacteroidetes bacterium]|nr:hypothetical protein [Bacteroidota bacterium]
MRFSILLRVSLLLALVLQLPLSAQSRELRLLIPASAPAHSTPVPVPAQASFMRVDTALFDAVVPATITSVTIPGFPLPDGTRHTLRMERFDVLSPTAVVLEGRRDGDRPASIEKHMAFRGTIDGVPGSFVYLMAFRNYCSGFVEMPQPGTDLGRRLLIAPDDMDAPDAVTIVFNENDVPQTTHVRYPCSTPDPFDERAGDPDALHRLLALTADIRKHPASSPQGEEMLVAQIAAESEYTYFTSHNSNFSHAANYLITNLGSASAVYQRDIRLALEVPFVRIWTTSTTPYPGPNDGDILGQVRDYWNANMGWVKRTGTYIFTSYRGGVAWVGTMCGGFAYAMGGLGGNINYPADGYVWDTDVTSHELGHNFGSPHTHSCYWAPAVDSCWPAEGGCFPTINPRPGTIMSYCHLNAGTRLTFHPRVATLIRTSAEQLPCVSPRTNPASADVAVTYMIAPANGSILPTNSTLKPSVVVRNIGTAPQADVPVNMTIATQAGAQVYRDSVVIASLAPGASAVATFKSMTVRDTATYSASASSVIAGDSAQENNLLTRTFQVVPATPNASVTLLYPNGGEVFASDSLVTISWTQNGVSQVTLELSPDNGATWQTIRWSQPGDSGHYQWKVPPVPTQKALVRISNTLNANVADRSDASFTIGMDNDAQVVEFLTPKPNATTDTAFTPAISIRNNGSRQITGLPVELKMIWRNGDRKVYDKTVTVPVVQSGETRQVTFPQAGMLPEGDLIMIARTMLANDRNPSNDSLARTSVTKGGISPPTTVVAHGLNHLATIEWVPSTTQGVTRYRIERGFDPEAMSPIALVRSSVLSYVDEGLQNDTLYYYAITAMNDSLESIPSGPAVADPMALVAGDTLRVPALLVPARDARSVALPVHLLWGSVKGAELYQIQLLADPNGTDVLGSWLSQSPQPITADMATFGSIYYWRARAFNNTFTGPWSKTWQFNTGQNCAGGALHFNGDGGIVLDSNFQWTGGPVTVEFWNYVMPDEVQNASAFGVGQTDDTRNRLQAHVPWSDRNVYWDYGVLDKDSGRIVADYSPYLGKWTHVALVSNGRNFKAIYLNGKLAASDTLASQAVALKWLTIGGNAAVTYKHKGAMDDFRIWSSARSQEEIERDMSRAGEATPGLAGYWKFDEGQGGIANGIAPPAAILQNNPTWIRSGAPINCADNSSLGAPAFVAPANAATIPSSPYTQFSWTPVGGADAYELQISGTTDFTAPEVSVPNIPGTSHLYGALLGGRNYHARVRAINASEMGPWSSVIAFTTGTPCAVVAPSLNGVDNDVEIPDFEWKGRAVTVEWWLYVDSTDVRNCWGFFTAAADSTTRISSHAPWGDKQLYFDFGNISTNGRIAVDYGPYLGKWTHVAMVSNGKDFKAIYLNGGLAGSGTIAHHPGWPRKGLTIGGARGGTGFQKSRITDFRVWNTARTQAAIRENMYRRLAGPQSGLIGYWALDGGTDSIVHDLSGFGHDGILRNAPAASAGPAALGTPAPTITGPIVVMLGATGAVYSVPDSSATTFNWTVSGGTIISGQGTPAITVDWGTDGDGFVSVLTTQKAGCEQTSGLVVRLSDGSGVPVTGVAAGEELDVRPNPVADRAELTIILASASEADVEIVNARGDMMRSQRLGMLPGGRRQIAIDTRGLASGLYFCRVKLAHRALIAAMRVVR